MWKRIPASLKQLTDSELQRVWSFVQCLIERKYPEAFQLMVSQRWSNNELRETVDKLAAVTRRRLFDSVSVAYSSVRVSELAVMLGLSVDETCALAHAHAWSLDPTHKFLIPIPTKTDKPSIANQVQMQQLTNLVSFLET